MFNSIQINVLNNNEFLLQRISSKYSHLGNINKIGNLFNAFTFIGFLNFLIILFELYKDNYISSHAFDNFIKKNSITFRFQ